MSEFSTLGYVCELFGSLNLAVGKHLDTNPLLSVWTHNEWH